VDNRYYFFLKFFLGLLLPTLTAKVDKSRFRVPRCFQFVGRAGDEGMTNGPPIFAYPVFGPGRVSLERLSRPIKATV
jgi:hypothetical protein